MCCDEIRICAQNPNTILSAKVKIIERANVSTCAKGESSL
jgi:hypothetical protein